MVAAVADLPRILWKLPRILQNLAFLVQPTGFIYVENPTVHDTFLGWQARKISHGTWYKLL